MSIQEKKDLDELEEQMDKPVSRCRVTIEPALFATLMAAMLVYLMSQNLILDKACRINLNLSEPLCDALAARNPNGTNNTEEYKEAEAAVQRVTARINQWKFFLDHAFPILFCLVMGAWSDKHGRKPLLLSSQTGYFCGAMVAILNVYFWDWSAETLVITYGLIHGLGGASVALNLATIAYIGDISSPETKTQRMGFAMIAFTMATPIGSAIAGPIYEVSGYYGTFGIAAGFNAVALLYIFVCVDETRDTRKHRKTILRDLFDASQVIYSIQTLIKPRPGWLRAKLFTLTFLAFLVTFYFGEMSIMYLYVIRVFNYTYTQYGLLNTYRFLVNIVGMAFTLGFVSYYMGVSDPMVGIIGCVSQVAATLCVTFSYAGGAWLLYAAPVVDFLNGAVVIVNKAMLTKSVPNNELGQLSAVLSVVEAFVPVVGNPVYSLVYEKTFETSFPGAAFLITAGIMALCIVAFTFLYIEYKKTVVRIPPIRLISVETISKADVF